MVVSPQRNSILAPAMLLTSMRGPKEKKRSQLRKPLQIEMLIGRSLMQVLEEQVRQAALIKAEEEDLGWV